jgi:hypothetical protein
MEGMLITLSDGVRLLPVELHKRGLQSIFELLRGYERPMYVSEVRFVRTTVMVVFERFSVSKSCWRI